jgi:lipoprotein-anchoring transpeptidase ErfK/SrfK
MAMMLRLGGAALAFLMALPAGEAAAQAGYPYAPSIPEAYYPPDVPPGYVARGVVRRVPPGYHDDDLVVVRRGRYYDLEGYPVRPYVRRYYVPAPYYGERDEPPARPYFRQRQDAGIGGAAPGAGIETERRWGDQRALLPGDDVQSRPLPQFDPRGSTRYSALPPATFQDGGIQSAPSTALAPRLRRQIVEYRTKEPAGTIVIDTKNTYLYYVLGDGQAVRYGIGVGREGFSWSGAEKISRKAEWPDWYPPKDMIERQPYLPRMMAGGPGNPLGSRALYLGNTLYRIHGTSDPSSIGQFVSSGCIRMLNEDVEDLYGRVKIGSRVVVLPGGKRPASRSARR